MFVDRVRVHLRSGDGGAGVVSFVRARGRPQGKPTGGSGGDGGDIEFRVDEGMASLLRYRRNPHHAADRGMHGSGDLKHGRRGADLVLSVPPGTIIRDPDGVVIGDLVAEGQSVVAVPGGRGGRGNAAFVSPSLRAPTVCEQGEYGREGWFELELRLMADAALVGFPNAGKSTFISTVSSARPKIADYPFTTLEPHLGVVAIDDAEFVLADIPGLIEGAAEGKGLGHEFLRHVERARVLVILLDPSITAQHPVDVQLTVLGAELEAFNPALVERPRLVVLGKGDLPEAADAIAAVPEAMVMSSKSGEGVNEVLYAVARLLEGVERDPIDREGYVLHRPVLAESHLVRVGEHEWSVVGLPAERAVRFADLTNPQAVDLASRRLSRLGIVDALAAAGAVEGDTVRIGDLEFEYHEPQDWDEGEEE